MRGTTPKGADVTAWIRGVNDFWVAKGNTALRTSTTPPRATTQSS